MGRGALGDLVAQRVNGGIMRLECGGTKWLGQLQNNQLMGQRHL